ncbi:MAG TPA: thioredoxin-dependent thiol peroxidase [Methylomirabilota bacterium]|nr:thioredoxin-dependent thiol peroxidase [Methylomirabilota bacterium]
MKASVFTLPDQNNKMHSLKDYQGKWLILYFYPKDDTPGCTKEACSFRDNKEAFLKRGVEIVGISKDSVASHQKFVTKHSLNFTLLADPDHKVIEQYGAWGKKKFMGKEYDGTMRNTFIINPKGEIVKEFKNVNPLTHTNAILQELDKLLSS